MKLTEEGRFLDESGTRLYMRVWEDENRVENPVVLVNVERDYGSVSNRTSIALDTAKSLGTTPDKIAWYEQSPDGSLREYKFEPYQAEFRPYANDMSLQAYRAAEKAGVRRPEIHTNYTTREIEVSPNEKKTLQVKVKDRLETFAQKQEREFEEMNFRFLGKSK